MKTLVEIVQVKQNTNIPKKDGGSYPGTLMIYKNNGRLVEKGLHSTILQNNKELADKVHSLQAGDTATLTVVKNGAFNNLTDVEKGNTTETSSGQVFTVEKTQAAWKQPYFEDTKKQTTIVRQNALGHATEIACHNAGKNGITTEEVIGIAKELERYVLETKYDDDLPV